MDETNSLTLHPIRKSDAVGIAISNAVLRLLVSKGYRQRLALFVNLGMEKAYGTEES